MLDDNDIPFNPSVGRFLALLRVIVPDFTIEVIDNVNKDCCLRIKCSGHHAKRLSSIFFPNSKSGYYFKGSHGKVKWNTFPWICRMVEKESGVFDIECYTDLPLRLIGIFSGILDLEVGDTQEDQEAAELYERFLESVYGED